MAFDTIMQVGKTPQVTADIAINPYTLQDDVTYLAFPTLSGGTPAGGSLLNVINPNFDYITYIACQVNSIGGTTFRVLFDLGKSLQLRGVLLYFADVQAGGGALSTGTIECSKNGIDWELLQSYTFPAVGVNTTTEHTFTTQDKEMRYFRVSHTTASDSNGMIFNSVQFKLSNIQRFY